MDWGHFALGGLALVLTALVLLRRATRRGIHVRIDIEREDQPNAPPDRRR